MDITFKTWINYSMDVIQIEKWVSKYNSKINIFIKKFDYGFY